jgi:hypothetical protein
VFEIEAPAFGLPLRNPLAIDTDRGVAAVASSRSRSMAFAPPPGPSHLRSQEWWGGTSRDNIYHRGWMKNQGYPHDMFDGRPGDRDPQHLVRAETPATRISISWRRR